MEFTQLALIAKDAPAQRGQQSRRPVQVTAEERARIIRLYEDGDGPTAISVLTGRSVSVIYGILTRAGIPRRIPSKGMLRLFCEACGEPMRYVPPCIRDKGRGRYCSKACAGEARRLPASLKVGGTTEFRCSRCGQTKHVDDFGPHATNGRGCQYWCKPCMAEARADRARVPDDPVALRKRRLWDSYRITMEEYDELYRRQQGCCAICGVPKEAWQPSAGMTGRGRFLVVDHCHVNGHVRGLLCGQCNIGLGQLRDDPGIMLAAAAYIGG